MGPIGDLWPQKNFWSGVGTSKPYFLTKFSAIRSSKFANMSKLDFRISSRDKLLCIGLPYNVLLALEFRVHIFQPESVTPDWSYDFFVICEGKEGLSRGLLLSTCTQWLWKCRKLPQMTVYILFSLVSYFLYSSFSYIPVFRLNLWPLVIFVWNLFHALPKQGSQIQFQC